MKYLQSALPNTRLELADSDDKTHIIDTDHEAWCGTLSQQDTQTWPTDEKQVTCPSCQKALKEHNEAEAKFDEEELDKGQSKASVKTYVFFVLSTVFWNTTAYCILKTGYKNVTATLLKIHFYMSLTLT